jgi:hypothetical protein
MFAILGLLVAAALLNGLHLPLFGRRIRPEHVVAPAVFLALILTQARLRAAAIRLDAFAVLAVAWVAVNALSSWLFAPHPTESFVHVVRFGLLVAAFLTVANLPMPRGADDWADAFRLWLALGVLALVYGISAWVLARYFSVWLPGTIQGFDQVEISIRGTQLERNLFGIAGATALSVSVYGLLAQRRLRPAALAPTKFLVGACFIAGIAVVCSLTRSAWVALAVVGPATYLLFERRRPASVDRPLLQLAFALPVFLGAMILLWGVLPSPRRANAAGAETPAASHASVAKPRDAQPPQGTAKAGALDPRAAAPAAPVVASEIVEDRLSTFTRLHTDVTLLNRVQDAKWALNDWRESPFLGRGTGSFVQIHGRRFGTEAWISNLVLHTLVDTGVVGLLIQMSLFWLVASRAWRAAAARTDAVFQIGLRALSIGLVVMFLAYQITDGTWLALFWIHLGLMANGVYASRGPAARVPSTDSRR